MKLITKINIKVQDYKKKLLCIVYHLMTSIYRSKINTGLFRFFS